MFWGVVILLLVFSWFFFADEFGGDSVVLNDGSGDVDGVLSLDERIVVSISENREGEEYLKINDDYVIVNKTKIVPSEFDSLISSSEYGDFFDNLPRRELYFVKIRSNSSKTILLGIVDLERRKPIKVVGVFVD